MTDDQEDASGVDAFPAVEIAIQDKGIPMKTRSFVGIGTFAIAAVSAVSSADIINNESQMAPGSTLMTFEDMPVAFLGAGPVRIGNITFSSNGGLSA